MPTSPIFHTIWYEIVSSTSSIAAQNINDYENGTIIAAEFQTSGRGQGDHKWISDKGANLTFSMILKYDGNHGLEVAEQQLLTMASSLAVTDFLLANGIEASIKRPNDIYVGKNKICGMLIENGIRGKLMDWSIIGIGINLNQTEFPEELINPTSMSVITGMTYDRTKCLNEFLKYFATRFDSIWTNREILRTEYCSKTLR